MSKIEGFGVPARAQEVRVDVDPDTDLKARMAGRLAGSLLNLDCAANRVSRGGKCCEHAVAQPLQFLTAAGADRVGGKLVVSAK